MRFWHDWCRQRGSRANSDNDSKSNANRNVDTNSFRNAIGHTTASYANGHANSFTKSDWKAQTDTTSAPDSTRSTDSAVTAG